jgi:hypothetical protein
MPHRKKVSTPIVLLLVILKKLRITDIKGKKSKLDINTKASKSVTWIRSDKPVDQLPNGRVSSAQLVELTVSHHRAETNPPGGNICPPSEPSYPSISTSLAAYSLSRLKSTQMGYQYRLSASPGSNTLPKKDLFDLHTRAMASDAQGYTDPSIPYRSTSYSYPLHETLSNTLPAAYDSHYEAPIDIPLRTLFREPARLLPPTNKDTTLSSCGGNDGYKLVFSKLLLPSMRMLPPPVPGSGAQPSPLDRHPLPVSSPAPSPQQHPRF